MESESLFRVGDLSPSPENPRVISDEEIRLLKNSLHELGDLGGIVFNRKAKHLVSGHQRVRAIQELGQNPDITIIERFSSPTSQGTVAIGYFLCNGERYGYREVEWEENEEKIALLAANKMGGRFDHEKLGNLLDGLAKDTNGNIALLEKTGFSQKFLESYVEDATNLRHLLIRDLIADSPERKSLLDLGEPPEDLPLDDLEDRILTDGGISQEDPALQATCPKCGHVFTDPKILHIKN